MHLENIYIFKFQDFYEKNVFPHAHDAEDFSNYGKTSLKSI